VRCPSPLALRTLKVVYRVDGDAAGVDALAERLLRTARPIANAVKGQPHAPRPACVDGRSMVLRRETDETLGEPGGSRVAHFWWFGRTTGNLVPCTVRGLGVELLDGSGRRLQVQGNPFTAASVADLPEASTGPEEAGELGFRLRWFNWCGQGRTRMRWIGEPGPGRPVPVTPPPCADRAKPSRLLVDVDP
jgi:hypothetical protein